MGKFGEGASETSFPEEHKKINPTSFSSCVLVEEN